MARLHKLTVMLGRTHGVPALPTTAGKEMINFAVDLKNQLIILRETEITAKISGAVGNRNELNIAFPKKDWKSITETFIKRLNLAPQTHTTQIESHSNKILIFNLLSQIARIGAKLAQDLWIYNSLGYLSWKDNAGHVGSSVMPHKINPIGAELAQTYFVTGSETLHVIANIIMENRMQRDLRDKYALRKTGEALAELLLAIEGITGSLRQIGFNEKKLADELNNHWEVLSASIQTILRIENVENPYDLLKKLSRGNTWTQEKFRNIIFQLPIEKSVKEKLQSLSPLTSTGEAVALVEDGIAQVNSFLKQS
jgi:adenylosuccinate lyase